MKFPYQNNITYKNNFILIKILKWEFVQEKSKSQNKFNKKKKKLIKNTSYKSIIVRLVKV